MKALPLRFDGPLQSWGGTVAGNDRKTLEAPTRSAVIGLCAGALGIDRSDSGALADLHRSVWFAVRCDRAGVRITDFHTALDVPEAAKGRPKKNAVLTRREYLQDAEFVALLFERPNAPFSLETIREALLAPRYMPFLGRKACVPATPVHSRADAILQAKDWRGLFELLPVRNTDAGTKKLAVWADADLPGLDVNLPFHKQRDVALPSVPRLFAERRVVRLFLEHASTGALPSDADFFDEAPAELATVGEDV
jgi:CRISPR system Cascade subunit CasD